MRELRLSEVRVRPQHSGGDFESEACVRFITLEVMVLDGSQENPQMPFWDVLAEKRRCIKAITLTLIQA